MLTDRFEPEPQLTRVAVTGAGLSKVELEKRQATPII